MSRILKRTSFGLLRTNPRLTTNIKLVADTKNKIYLETIDADPILSKSIYKGFELSISGSYSYDLKRFYSQNGNLLPADIAYRVFEEDSSLNIKNRYKNQYDFTYGMGMYPKNSRLYSEEFAIFAPLWLEQDNLPDYFVIFKMDGPVTINPNEALPGYPNGYTGDFDNAPFLNTLIEDPINFFKNYVQKAKIVKTFDLTESTVLGTYLRNHINDPRFPESSLYTSLDKGAQSFWNGISYTNGGFAEKGADIYKEYTLLDKTITEADDFITSGFHNNGIVCSNIMNMEFLFDDTDQDVYKFSRYFGMYVNAIELGKFTIDPIRLYNDRDSEITQYPRPEKPIIGDPTRIVNQIQRNSNGIKVYPKIGVSGPYSGRLLTFTELQNPRFAYIKDNSGTFHSIDNANNWETVNTYPSTGGTYTPYSVVDDNYLRIKDDIINWKSFGGFEAPFDYVPAIETDIFGRPAMYFSIISSLTNGDEIRLRYTDWTDPRDIPFIDPHTIRGSSTEPAGTANGLLFSVNGTYKEIASAIVKAINNIEIYAEDYQITSAISIDNQVIIFSRIASENWNKIKVSLFSDAPIFPFDLSNQYVAPQSTTTYQPSPISTSPLNIGNLVTVKLDGGNNRTGSRAIVEQKVIQEFRDPLDTIYVKTKTGFDTTGRYGLYLDEPIISDSGVITGFRDIDKYYVINLADLTQEFAFGSSKKLGLYKLAKNSLGYLSILPIKDFDFDFESDEYNKPGDANPTKLYEWYKGTTGSTGSSGEIPVFNWASIGPAGSTSQTYINDIIGPASSFVIGGGFQQLIGQDDEDTDTIDVIRNEYDRLKENTIPDLALSSRVVPFINKWVYDNESVDVRENGYRLNSNPAFGYSNFSPSFDEASKNTKFFTHEWYYLQKYPPYMTLLDKINSFSYFDEDLYPHNFPALGSTGSTAYYFGMTGATGASANLLSINEDYFVSYFTRESVDGLPINRDFKYSIFGIGNESRPSETLFRGAKIDIKDRAEFAHMNYNKNSKRFILGEKYNGYRFTAVLTYGNEGTQITAVKNDKFRSLTLLIQANFNTDLLRTISATGATGKFIDRAMLYCIDDNLAVNAGGTGLEYTDSIISGFITGWTDTGSKFVVSGGPDNNGNFPSFITEFSLNQNGSYNDVYVTDGIYTYTFEEISEVSGNQFSAQRITGLPSPNPSPLLPTTSNNYNPYIISTFLPLLLPKIAPLFTNPIYKGGGYNAYRSIIESISFSNIAEVVNSGDPQIKYVNVTANGTVEFDTYCIDITRPDYPLTSSYLKKEVLRKTPSDLQVSAPILGYKLTALPRVAIQPTSRYRGPYNPKWRDVIKFVDTQDIVNEGLSYYNIQMLTNLGYYADNNIGQLNTLYYNKVNVENPNIILKNSSNKLDYERFIYPLIGEIAIDWDNFFIFKSNWDAEYYKKYLRSTTRVPVIGTREPKEEKSFFGSKTIAIPNGVRLETFPAGTITEEELLSFASINTAPQNIVQRSKKTATKLELTLDIYVTSSLQDWLIADGFSAEFSKYININYSFGDRGLEDDVKTYISENIFDRYSVKEIIFWEKIWNPKRGTVDPPQIVTNLTDIQKINAGYTISKNFRTIEDSTGGLNFQLIYTVPSDKRTSIAFTVVLEKK